jgi:hypothetical protein
LTLLVAPKEMTHVMKAMVAVGRIVIVCKKSNESNEQDKASNGVNDLETTTKRHRSHVIILEVCRHSRVSRFLLHRCHAAFELFGGINATKIYGDIKGNRERKAIFFATLFNFLTVLLNIIARRTYII